MDLSIYLPVAGTSVPILLLLAIGLLVGGLSGFFGVGAGFLLAPLLITIGIPPTVAAGSCANHVVAASASGAIGHARNLTVDFRMAAVLLLGGLAGGTLGVRLIRLLDETGHAGLAVTMIFVAILGAVGFRMFRESLRTLRIGEPRRGGGRIGTLRRTRLERLVEGLPSQTVFPRSGVRASLFVPLGAGVLVGLVIALTGIGGGVLLVPLLVRTLGMPLRLAVGTVLLVVCLAAINVTLQHALLNGCVDVVLALVLFVGSVIGARVGTRASRWINASQLRILLAVIVLFATAKLASDLLLPPEVPVSVAEATPSGFSGGPSPEAGSSAAPPTGSLAVAPEILEFGLFHASGRIEALAPVPPDARAVFRLVGPRERLRLRTKSRVAGILWADTGERVHEGVPAVLLVNGWPRAPADEDLIGHELGWRALARSVLSRDPGPKEQRGFRELIAMKKATGRFVQSGSHEKTPDGRARVEFLLPRDAPPGDYTVDVHVLDAAGVDTVAERRVVLRRREAIAAIGGLARDRDALYALLAVLLALGIGVSAGLLVGLGSRMQSRIG